MDVDPTLRDLTAHAIQLLLPLPLLLIAWLDVSPMRTLLSAMSPEPPLFAPNRDWCCLCLAVFVKGLVRERMGSRVAYPRTACEN